VEVLSVLQTAHSEVKMARPMHMEYNGHILKANLSWTRKELQGRRQKIFQGGRGRGSNEKRPKISKKYRKIALFASSRGGTNGKKTEK